MSRATIQLLLLSIPSMMALYVTPSSVIGQEPPSWVSEFTALNCNAYDLGGSGLAWGYVRDQNGMPVEGAYVSIHDGPGGRCWVLSKEDGRFALRGLPNQHVEINVRSSQFFALVRLQFDASAGPTRIDVELFNRTLIERLTFPETETGQDLADFPRALDFIGCYEIEVLPAGTDRFDHEPSPWVRVVADTLPDGRTRLTGLKGLQRPVVETIFGWQIYTVGDTLRAMIGGWPTGVHYRLVADGQDLRGVSQPFNDTFGLWRHRATTWIRVSCERGAA